MNKPEHQQLIILVAGHWLGAWAWDEVLTHLSERQHSALALTLPGLDPNDPQRLSRTPTDQADAIVSAMVSANTASGYPVVLVGHSGANAPISIALDRHPELVSRMIWVDSGPVADGSVFDPDCPADLPALPLPSFEALGTSASLEGLDPDALARFRKRALPEPGPILRTPIMLANNERRNVATTLICCSISGNDILAMAESGHPMMSEVAHLTNLAVVDLPTGHWPMWSRPRDLAELIGKVPSPL